MLIRHATQRKHRIYPFLSVELARARDMQRRHDLLRGLCDDLRGDDARNQGRECEPV